jgi:hypothetical protein
MGKKHFFVNLHEIDGNGGSKIIRSGATRDASKFIGAPEPAPSRTPQHEDCSRCRGTGGGPNPFVAERKCKKCQGLGFVLAG